MASSPLLLATSLFVQMARVARGHLPLASGLLDEGAVDSGFFLPPLLSL